jgi:hypothetical protein
MRQLERVIPLPEQINALGAVLSNLDEITMTDSERAEAVVWAWEGMRLKGVCVFHETFTKTAWTEAHERIAQMTMGSEGGLSPCEMAYRIVAMFDAQGIETRSAIDAKRRGPKGESPVRDSECAQDSPKEPIP